MELRAGADRASYRGAMHQRVWCCQDKVIGGWSIDSRTVKPGDLFFAIKGERFDGHAFLPLFSRQAPWRRWSVKRLTARTDRFCRCRYRRGASATGALRARKQWGKPLVAVTGSAGKTTTKDIIAALAERRLSVGKTTGNLNNHIGLPLSLAASPG